MGQREESLAEDVLPEAELEKVSGGISKTLKVGPLEPGQIAAIYPFNRD